MIAIQMAGKGAKVQKECDKYLGVIAADRKPKNRLFKFFASQNYCTQHDRLIAE